MILRGSSTLSMVIGAWTLLASVQAGASPEQRCTELGNQCICSEPMQTTTHDGGKPYVFAASGIPTDPDDTSTKECPEFGYRGNIGVIASAEDGFLPPGHSVSYVFKQSGSGEVRLYAPDVNEPPNSTYCIRSYHRYDPTTTRPNASYNSSTGNSQYKAITIGGLYLNAHNPIQMGETSGGTFYRFDSALYGGGPQPTYGSMDECRTNWCRYEQCADFDSGGHLRVRQRKVVLARNADPIAHEYIRPTSSISQPIFQLTGGYVWIIETFIQNVPPPNIFYFTYGMAAHKQPMDGNFWIGPADEVEGGSGSGGGPAPSAPPASPLLHPPE
jgi:hypothetical protein